MTRKSGTGQASVRERNGRFVKAYIAHGENATEAYLSIKPHVARTTAGVEGHRLLKLPQIQKAIAASRAALRAKFALTTDRVVQEQARIIYFNPKNLLDDKGKALPLHQVGDDTAAALSVVEFNETEVRGKGKDKVTIHRKVKHRPYNKVSALNMANKILRIYDKPPPPPPEAIDQPAEVDRSDLARRLAFVLAEEAHTTEKKAAPAKPATKKKISVPA